MQFGLSTYTYSWSIGVLGKEPPERMDAAGLLNIAVQKGIKCIQVADNLPLHRLTVDQRNDFKKLAANFGITIETGTRGMMPENIREYLEIAGFFGSPILRAVIDTGDFQPGIGEIKSIISDFLPELKKRKIVLAIENHDRLKAREFGKLPQILHRPPWNSLCQDKCRPIHCGQI